MPLHPRVAAHPGTERGRLVIENAVKVFRARGQPVPTLDDVSLSIAPGGFVSLIGPSGCGKTTLLRVIAGLETLDSGSVLIDGVAPNEIRKRYGLSVAFQDAALLPWRSVEGNIRLPLELSGKAKEQSDLVGELIRLVGLEGFERSRPSQLSGGMQQRVSIARALAGDPEVLLLDEPFASVDEITRQRLNVELLRVLEQRRNTTVLVTHSVSEAIFLSDHVVVLSSRPAHVVEVIDVPFDKPRPPELTKASEFHRICDQAFDRMVQGMA